MIKKVSGLLVAAMVLASHPVLAGEGCGGMTKADMAGKSCAAKADKVSAEACAAKCPTEARWLDAARGLSTEIAGLAKDGQIKSEKKAKAELKRLLARYQEKHPEIQAIGLRNDGTADAKGWAVSAGFAFEPSEWKSHGLHQGVEVFASLKDGKVLALMVRSGEGAPPAAWIALNPGTPSES